MVPTSRATAEADTSPTDEEPLLAPLLDSAEYTTQVRLVSEEERATLLRALTRQIMQDAGVELVIQVLGVASSRPACVTLVPDLH